MTAYLEARDNAHILNDQRSGKYKMMSDNPKECASVLIVSDEPESAAVWAFSLKQAGLDVCVAGFSDKTLQVWSAETPDIVILEDYKARLDVVEFCQKMRLEAAVPLLLLTSRYDESYMLKAYESGVDDCLTQPISPRLLLVKVRAWLRRAQVVPIGVLNELSAGNFILAPDRRLITLPDGKVLKLTNLETRLLYILMNHHSWVMETDYLVDRVWGHSGNGDSVLLKNLIYRLRRKIEPDPSQPRYLLTETNIGYKFQAAADSGPASGISTVNVAGNFNNGVRIRNTNQLHNR